MSYKITLCSSCTFFDKLAPIKDELNLLGYTVFFPHVWDWTQETEDGITKVQHDLIKRHFKNIDGSDAIYVANFDKKGIQNYIGGNTLLEMGKAFDRNIPVFLMNDIPDMMYTEEIRAIQPYVIGKDWCAMENIIKAKKSN